MPKPLQFDSATEEQASLYVLESLAADARTEFERRLQGDAALRELVRDLQGNLDAEVFALPVRPAPLAVWGRIAARVEVEERLVVPFPAGRTWGARLLAAAACVALGALFQAWVSRKSLDSELVGARPGLLSPATNAASPSATASVPASPVPVPTVPPVRDVASAVTPPTNQLAEAEARALRERVRVLAAQLGALNQALTQHLALPPGVTRLQVFQLADTNVPSGGMSNLPGREEARRLPELLAQLSADQMQQQNRQPDAAAGAGAGQSTSAGGVTSVPLVPAGTDPASATTPGATSPVEASADLGSLLGATVGSSALGFLAPESGVGTLALTTDSPLSQNEVFQVWSQTTGGGGETIFSSLGVAAAPGNVVVLRFDLPPGNAAPSLLVTREPSGGSTTPSGPVVVGPRQSPP